MKLTVLVFFGALLASQTAWGNQGCSARDVRGTYAFQADGAVLVPATPITGPFMRLGWIRTDGFGSINASTLAVYNGINFGLEIYGGTYTVTNDCSISLKLLIPSPVNANAVFKGTISNDGEDIMFMLMSTENPQTPPITTVLGHARRQLTRNCNVRDLDGPYRFEVNGYFGIPPVSPSATAIRLLGQVKGNRAGSLTSVSFIESIGGNIAQETGTGSYTVNSDCTFAMSFSVGGSPMIMRGSLIGLGDEAFVVLNPQGQTVNVPPFGNVVINGTVATGTMKKIPDFFDLHLF